MTDEETPPTTPEPLTDPPIDETDRFQSIEARIRTIEDVLNLAVTLKSVKTFGRLLEQLFLHVQDAGFPLDWPDAFHAQTKDPKLAQQIASLLNTMENWEAAGNTTAVENCRRRILALNPDYVFPIPHPDDATQETEEG